MPLHFEESAREDFANAYEQASLAFMSVQVRGRDFLPHFKGYEIGGYL